MRPNPVRQRTGGLVRAILLTLSVGPASLLAIGMIAAAAEALPERQQTEGSPIATSEAQGNGSPPTDEPAGHATATAEKCWEDVGIAFAAALAISLTAFATAMTQCRIGSAGVGAMAENPKLFASILICLVIPETMVILGFVIAALIVI